MSAAEIAIAITNAMPDEMRAAIYPILRVVAYYIGIRIWEDGSLG